MSFQCLDPYVAIKRFEKLNGKADLQLFSKSRIDYDLQTLKFKYGEENVFVLPCGKCESCKRNRAEEWAIRCELEAKEHKYNYFLTLTFDDYHIKAAGDHDLRTFLDNLAGWNNKNKYKYFCSREFGDLTGRIHFHCVLFCDFEIDLKEPVKLGVYYHYHSNLISECWPFGLHDIAPFECTCARYVAKYTSKDSKLFMSRNIGKTYFIKHYQEIIKDNFKVYSNFGGKMSAYIPQAFIRWFDEVDPAIAINHKKFKKEISKLAMAEKRRSYVLEHEEGVIYNEQRRVKEKARNIKKL